MTNGNDYLEIEEKHMDDIVEDYIEDVSAGSEDIPEKYIYNWITNYIAGNELANR